MKAYPVYKDSKDGWTGQIPESWKMMQLKFLTDNHDGKRIPVKAEDRGNMQGNYPYYGATGIIDYVNDFLFDGEYLLVGEDGAPFFLPQDVAFIATGKFWVNNHAHILKCKNGSDIRFLKHALNSVDYAEYITGSTRDKLTQSDLSRIRLPIPSLPEQQAIADFLDRKTAQIDTLIEKKQRQIDLLQEQRTALINHAVTKGLNPNVKMKDSGVEWLGEIPSHWEVAKLSYLTERIGDGLHGTPEYVDSSDYYFINGNNLVKGEIQFFESTKCVSEDEFKKYDVGLNDKTILLSINGTIGNVAFYQGEKVMLGKSAAFIVFQDDLLKNYFFHYLQSTQIQNYFGLESTGTTIFNLSLKSIRSTPLPLPPDDEKKAITDYLDKQQLEFDKATDIITRQIAHLQEYRTALISEAVTGKIDVRTAE